MIEYSLPCERLLEADALERLGIVCNPYVGTISQKVLDGALISLFVWLIVFVILLVWGMFDKGWW